MGESSLACAMRIFSRSTSIMLLLRAPARHGELRQCLLVAGLDVAFELLRPPLGLFQVQQVLLGIDR